MRTTFYTASLVVASSLLTGCFLDGDDGEALAVASCNMTKDGVYLGGFGSDVPENGMEGAIVITDDCSARFLGDLGYELDGRFGPRALEITPSSEYNLIAYTASYTEGLPSAFYDPADIIELIEDDYGYMCNYIESWDCEVDLTAENLDALVGTIIGGTNVTWYTSAKFEDDGFNYPVLEMLERIETEYAPIHIGFSGEAEDEGCCFPVVVEEEPSTVFTLDIAEIDQNQLTPEADSLGLVDAYIGSGGGMELQFFGGEENVSVDQLAGDWGPEKPAGFSIYENGSFEGGDIAGCDYSGQITDRENQVAVFDMTLNVSCPAEGPSPVNGEYTGILVIGGSFEPVMVFQVDNGEYMITDVLYSFDFDERDECGDQCS